MSFAAYATAGQGRGLASQNAAVLPVLRRCLTEKGYRFTDRR